MKQIKLEKPTVCAITVHMLCRQTVRESSQQTILFIFFKDICAFERCMNGGTCTSHENRHACTCADGYLGNNCQFAGKS